MRHGTTLLILALAFAAPAPAFSQSGGDDPAELVATQVRDQGLQCDEPTSATEDRESEGDAVWTLKCANASYHVRLVPDMAAAIEKID